MPIIVQALSWTPTAKTARSFEAYELLEALAAWGGEEVVALVPASAEEEAPPGLSVYGVPLPSTLRAALAFEVRGAARLAASLGGDVLYSLEQAAPWRSPIPAVATAESATGPNASRWKNALRRASLGGAAAVLLADDLPARPDLPNVQRVPPMVSASFHPSAPPGAARGGNGPEGKGDFVLSWAEDEIGWRRALAAWTWVDASLGDSVRLVLLVPDESTVQRARGEARRLGIEETVEPRVPQGWHDVADLHRGARAVIHAGAFTTPQVFRWSLASGAPLAGEFSPEAASIVGPAGYLVPPSDTRALGAAALTLLVEESVAERLGGLGLERAHAYDQARGLSRRLELLRSVARGAA